MKCTTTMSKERMVRSFNQQPLTARQKKMAVVNRQHLHMHLFVQFLTHHNMLDAWMTNMINASRREAVRRSTDGTATNREVNRRLTIRASRVRSSPTDALNRSFAWSDTPERNAWLHLHKQWQKVVEHTDVIMHHIIMYGEPVNHHTYVINSSDNKGVLKP